MLFRSVSQEVADALAADLLVLVRRLITDDVGVLASTRRLAVVADRAAIAIFLRQSRRPGNAAKDVGGDSFRLYYYYRLDLEEDKGVNSGKSTIPRC